RRVSARPAGERARGPGWPSEGRGAPRRPVLRRAGVRGPGGARRRGRARCDAVGARRRAAPRRARPAPCTAARENGRTASAMNHRIALFLAPSLALVAGCSSSSRRSADGGLAAPAAIVVDTSRAGTYGLDARIDVLALERGDGSFTPNLLSGSATVAIARPSGTSDGLALAELPPGVYVALRLLLAEDGVVATDAQGRRETVAVASRDVRVAFARPVDWQGGGIRWLGLQSVAEPELQRDASGRLVWMPHLAVRPGDLQPVTRAVFTVTAVQGEEVSGVLASCGRLPVRARFHEDCVL